MTTRRLHTKLKQNNNGKKLMAITQQELLYKETAS